MSLPLTLGMELNKWIIGRLLGRGAFSDVYEGRRRGDGAGKTYAIKVSKLGGLSPARSPGKRAAESASAAEKLRAGKRRKKKRKKSKKEAAEGADLLYWEYMLYRGHAAGHSSLPKVPMDGYGESGSYRYLVMDLLGVTLEQRWRDSRRRFKPATAAILGVQCLAILRQLHDRKLVYRDVKPANFFLGAGADADRVYCADLGAAARWVDFHGNHIEQRAAPGLIGTPTYVSLNVHDGLLPTRRDDIESLLYMLILFQLGRLPWSDASSAAELEAIKRSTTPSQLCAALHPNFTRLLCRVRELRFEEQPPYDELSAMMEQVVIDCGAPPTTLSFTPAKTPRVRRRAHGRSPTALSPSAAAAAAAADVDDDDEHDDDDGGSDENDPACTLHFAGDEADGGGKGKHSPLPKGTPVFRRRRSRRLLGKAAADIKHASGRLLDGRPHDMHAEEEESKGEEPPPPAAHPPLIRRRSRRLAGKAASPSTLL